MLNNKKYCNSKTSITFLVTKRFILSLALKLTHQTFSKPESSHVLEPLVYNNILTFLFSL